MDKKKKEPKEHLGVMFKCCKIYSRIYINAKRTAFVGWCPKCAKRVEVKIGPGGSDSRFFEVS